MKIQVLNDLHIEFDHSHTMPKLKGGDVLLLPGDVCVASFLNPRRTDKDGRKHKKACEKFFKEECAKYDRVYYIMGNHEHYHGVFENTPEILRDFLKDTNVTLLDKEFVELNDQWQLFGGTLWTDYHDQDWFAMHAAKDKMNDHSIISRFKDNFVGKFLPHDAVQEHRETIKILEENIYEMERIDRPTIVMTHHAPTGKSVHECFTGDILNYAYYTELSELILDHPNIKYWVHGHTHFSFDYNVGDCRVICNPRGYQGHETNADFDLNFEFEI